jgi:hypothetical protein
MLRIVGCPTCYMMSYIILFLQVIMGYSAILIGGISVVFTEV